jgi:hypothetical protein
MGRLELNRANRGDRSPFLPLTGEPGNERETRGKSRRVGGDDRQALGEIERLRRDEQSTTWRVCLVWLSRYRSDVLCRFPRRFSLSGKKGRRSEPESLFLGEGVGFYIPSTLHYR